MGVAWGNWFERTCVITLGVGVCKGTYVGQTVFNGPLFLLEARQQNGSRGRQY